MVSFYDKAGVSSGAERLHKTEDYLIAALVTDCPDTVARFPLWRFDACYK